MSKMEVDGLNQKTPQTLTDDQIVTEKSLARRSFLAATSVALVGGAAALVLGTNALGQSQDPDKSNNQDPDKVKDPGKAKARDPQKAQAHDPDKAKSQDPDKAKVQHPYKAKAQDPRQS